MIRGGAARGGRAVRVAAAAALAAALAAPALAQRTEPLPEELEGVGITERRDAQLPLDLPFRDSQGNAVRLGDYLHDGRPVLLSLVYYRCPMLCTLVLNGMVDALRDVPLAPGQDFELITVSIDPVETPALARAKQDVYVAEYGHPEAGRGWHFLTGGEESIQALAEAVGFGYRYDADRNEYAHAAALFVVTPDGRVSRYLYGVLFDPRTVRLSLVEASEGRIGSALDQILLYCYHFDAAKGRYAPAAMRLMRAAGAFTVILLGSFLAAQWVREARRKRAA
jgi:protein SCO1